MPRIPEDDLSEIFDIDGEFSDVAIINGVSVSGYLSNQYIETLDVVGTAPVFLCAVSVINSIIPAVDRETPAVINGVAYSIDNLEPEGNGITKLILNKD